MKALVLEKDRSLNVRHDWAIPDPAGNGSVLIQVAACGVSGSDVHRSFYGGATRYPLVMGHEFSGTVAETSKSGAFREGDRVAVFPVVSCKKCEPCKTADPARCESPSYLGSTCDGAFGEFIRVPEANLFRLPERVKTLHAAMVHPAAVALHAVRKLQARIGETAVVLGAGPIGNLAAQWLRIHGCRRVFIADVDEIRLALAGRMGFETLNSRERDPAAALHELTEGEGAGLIVEACGVSAAYGQAIKMAHRAGQIVFLGTLRGSFQLSEKDFSQILQKELTIRGSWNSRSCGSQDDWSTVLKFLDAELQVAPLITDTPSLEEGQAIFESVAGKQTYHNKVIFKIAR